MRELTKERMDLMEEVVRGGGPILLEANMTADKIASKEGFANFVTEYDVASQKYLIRELGKLLPEASFYGEEATEGNRYAEGLYDGYCFIIDPIDGTTNFLHGYDMSCISVGLAYKGEMQAAFVYNPYTGKMYRGKKGEGAFLNGEKLRIPDLGISEGVVAFGASHVEAERVRGFFKNVTEIYMKAHAVRTCGSAAWDLCRVASGSNIAYFQQRLNPYDYAAASLLIEEAGGVICQMNGDPIVLDHKISILAGTPKGVKELLEMNLAL